VQASSKVVVLILSYNGKHLLDDSVSSYLANDYENFEVVVIDNGSADGTLEFVKKKYPKAEVIRLEKNRGYSGGFNFGLDYAFNQKKAEYALITNNDVKVDHQIIRALVDTAEKDPSIGFVTGKAYYFDHPDTLQSVGKFEDKIRWNGEHIGSGEKDQGQHDQESERHFIDDIFMLTSKDVYHKVGGYSTEFFFEAEEYDWQARAKKAGFRIMYTPHAKLWHKESMTIGKQSAFKAYYDSRNPMLVIMLHRSRDYFRRYFWHQCRRKTRSALVSIKQLKFKAGLNKISGIFSALWWGIRHKKLSVRHFI
jgi:GT2 family glycosyltransferase